MSNKTSVNELAANILLGWRASPISFIEEGLHISLDDQQKEMLKYSSKTGCRLAIKSCRGAGKTMLLAVLTLWYLLCFTDVSIRIYSPSHKQLTENFIRECRKFYKELDPIFQSMLEIQTERIIHLGDKTNTAVVMTANASTLESLSGVHSDMQISMLDEASAIEDAVFATILGSHGTAIDGGIVIATSNPTRSSGFYAELFEKKPESWDLLTFTAYKSDHISEDFIKEMIDIYGEDSDEVRVSVLGLFPRADSSVFIPPSLVEEAVARYVDRKMYQSEPILMGIDVARSRSADKSVLCLRQGNKVLDLYAFQTIDTMEVVTRARDLYYERKVQQIYIDSVGVGGPVGDRLRELGLNVIDVHSGVPARDKTQYANVRTELWGEMREYLVTADIPDHTELRKELCNMKYGYSGKMQFQLVAKRSMRSKESGGSPDYADSLALTFFETELSIRRRRVAFKRKVRKTNHLWV